MHVHTDHVRIYISPIYFFHACSLGACGLIDIRFSLPTHCYEVQHVSNAICKSFLMQLIYLYIYIYIYGLVLELFTRSLWILKP